MNHRRWPRFPPTKILVPLDLSEASAAAWSEASWLSRRFAAPVDGLYIQPWLHSALGLGPGDPDLTAAAERSALALLRQRYGREIPVAAASGAVEETIVSWGRDLDYDLIVMGTHGRTGLERAFKGSVAETVVRHSTVPVWVLRRAKLRVREVLAPVNFEDYSLAALEQAASVAVGLGARLTALHVVALSSPGARDAAAAKGPRHLLDQALGRLPARLTDACRPRRQLLFGDPAERILEASSQSDLLVLSAHRKGSLSQALLGTTAERVLRHSVVPVLAVPAAARRSASRPPALRS